MNLRRTSTIYVVRHGRTPFNADGRLRGRADPPLDEVGLAEAEEVARELAEVGLGTVVTSPRLRAITTAQRIETSTGAVHVVDPRFDDRDYGPCTGWRLDDVLARWPSVDEVPGVEPSAVLLSRVERGLVAAADRAEDRPVAVVTHDAVITAVLRLHAPDRSHGPIATGSITELHVTDGAWRVTRIGDRHLTLS